MASSILAIVVIFNELSCKFTNQKIGLDFNIQRISIAHCSAIKLFFKSNSSKAFYETSN